MKKLSLARILSLGLLLALPLLYACQGEEPHGNPENCYFIFSTSVEPNQEGCPNGGTLGYDIHFVNESGQVIEFNNLVVPNTSGTLMSLPGGHTYQAFVFNNGNQTGGCTLLEFTASILDPDPLKTCATFRITVDERPSVISYTRPIAEFTLPDFCDGCAKIETPQPRCQSSIDCESNNNERTSSCTVPALGYASGALHTTGDVDWYRLAPAPDENCFDVIFIAPPGADYRIELYRDDQLVAGPQQYGLSYCALPTANYHYYYLKVYGLDGDFDPYNCYSFEVDMYNVHEHN